MKREGWIKTHNGPYGLGAIWCHESGWGVTHCGHQTALRPWSISPPQGTRQDDVPDLLRRCFQHLKNTRQGWALIIDQPAEAGVLS